MRNRWIGLERMRWFREEQVDELIEFTERLAA